MNSKHTNHLREIQKKVIRFGWPFLCVLMAGCSRFELHERLAVFDTVVASHKCVSEDIQAGAFVLRTVQHVSPSKILRIYIEGDGFGWRKPNEPSTNPTPVDPVALRIALNNDTGTWVYLARPCQYTMKPLHRCTSRMWTTHIYSSQALKALSHAIDHVKKKLNPQRIDLIGYSGGGTMALLLKATRTDIAHVTTIASNIDVHAWVKSLGLTPLPHAMNPADYVPQICGGTYTFIWGSNDTLVTKHVFQPFIARLSTCAHVTQITHDATHHSGWGNLNLAK